MIALVLAAALSFEQKLQSFDEFLQKAEIEVTHPLTEQMVTKKVTHKNGDFLEVWIQNKYTVTYLRERVNGFQNVEEKPFVRFTRLDPDDMKRWSEQPCVIDEKGAVEIASRIFKRLPFHENDFDPVEVHRHSWQPSLADPEHVLWIPLFNVMWYQKGYPRTQAVPASVRMEISGVTKKLVFFADMTEKPQSTDRPTPPQAKAKEK